MTPSEHKKRHIALHKALDELLADFIRNTKKLSLSKITVLELLRWSATQIETPDHNP